MSDTAPKTGRITRLVEDRDWRVLAAGVAVIALTGLGVWWLANRGSEDGSEQKKRRTKRKKSKQSSGSRGLSADKGETESEEPAIETFTDAQIQALPLKERKAYAQKLKAKSNNAYTAKKYEEAIQGYTQAIRFHPEDPVFYANRAACYLSLGRHRDCIRDCDEALKRDNAYIKALNRRATAHENLMEYEAAVNDYTACCIIDGFQNQAFAVAMERALKALTDEKTKEVIQASCIYRCVYAVI
jgi:import receptor subunit TOM70